MIKKNFILTLGLLALTSIAGALSYTKSPRFQVNVPVLQSAGPDLRRVWAPPSMGQQANNSTCQLVHTGAALIVGVSGMGDAGGGIAIFDTNLITSMSYAAPDTTKLITKLSLDTSKVSGVYDFQTPLPAVNGIVICPKDATVTASERFFKVTQ